MMSDPDAEFETWAREQVMEPMKDSAAAIPIWTGNSDWKISLEVGAAVLLDKPILMSGSNIPAKLRAVADRIVEVDISTDDGRADAAKAIDQSMRDFIHE